MSADLLLFIAFLLCVLAYIFTKRAEREERRSEERFVDHLLGAAKRHDRWN